MTPASQSRRVKPFSDLDLALTGQALQPQDLFALREAMSDSNLPFRVDICYWTTCPHAGVKPSRPSFFSDLFRPI
ncbi:MAG: hypothetical protein Q7T07_05835 [Burkholderiaceae bacterium]|nr:hypothetical protein [Burkholderiaceae bacterium]